MQCSLPFHSSIVCSVVSHFVAASIHIAMQPATSTRQCGMCLSLGKQCENCENDALHRDAVDADMESTADNGGGAKARSKSPLVNSAERNSKWAKVDDTIPLARIPYFFQFVIIGNPSPKSAIYHYQYPLTGWIVHL